MESVLRRPGSNASTSRSALPSAWISTSSSKSGRFRKPSENDKNPIVLVYRADAFNLFNRTNFGLVVGTVGNANFGRPTGPQNGARLITMGLRLEF